MGLLTLITDTLASLSPTPSIRTALASAFLHRLRIVGSETAILRILLLAFLLQAAPFWETKAPKEWTGAEIELLLTTSPWSSGSPVAMSAVPIFLASARPMREAEEQLFLRQERQGEVRADEDDYHTYITQNPGKHIVVAARVEPNAQFADAKEIKTMEKECFIRVGKRKIRSVGYFPPTPSDPYLRILFPRVPLDGLKILSVGLYLPGVRKPFEDAEFLVKDLKDRGKLEY